MSKPENPPENKPLPAVLWFETSGHGLGKRDSNLSNAPLVRFPSLIAFFQGLKGHCGVPWSYAKQRAQILPPARGDTLSLQNNRF